MFLEISRSRGIRFLYLSQSHVRRALLSDSVRLDHNVVQETVHTFALHICQSWLTIRLFMISLRRAVSPMQPLDLASLHCGFVIMYYWVDLCCTLCLARTKRCPAVALVSALSCNHLFLKLDFTIPLLEISSHFINLVNLRLCFVPSHSVHKQNWGNRAMNKTPWVPYPNTED